MHMSRSNRAPRAWSRRQVLMGAGLGVGAVATSSLLAACGSGREEDAGQVIEEGELSKLVPTYAQLQIVDPDLPGSEFAQPGFLTYPAELARAVAEKPGVGGEYTALVASFEPAPPPDSSYATAVTEALGATIRFTHVPAADYSAKLATVMAGGDIPDITQVLAWDVPNDIGRAAEQLFVDLTPYLAGDIADQYPNLANVPTSSWEAAVFNGRLFAIPLAGTALADAMFYRKDITDAAGLSEPTNKDELVEWCTALTKPSENQWAIGTPAPLATWMFRVPSNYRSEGGKLVHRYQTEEFLEAIEFARTLQAAGYVHPDFAGGQAPDSKAIFASGRVVAYHDGIGAWLPAVQQQAPVNPSFQMQAMKPFAADGGTPIHYADGTNTFYTFLSKNLSEDSIEEVLRIANFAAAPFGTVEYELIRFGTEGEHFTYGDDGAPHLTDVGLNTIGFAYSAIAAPPPSLFHGNHPDVVQAQHAWETEAAKVAVTSPIRGLHVEIPERLSSAGQRVEDTVNSVLNGRRTMKDLEAAIDSWWSRAGEQVTELYEQALAAR